MGLGGAFGFSGNKLLFVEEPLYLSSHKLSYADAYGNISVHTSISCQIPPIL